MLLVRFSGRVVAPHKRVANTRAVRHSNYYLCVTAVVLPKTKVLKPPRQLLVLCFSPLGDSAMCVPVLRALFMAHPKLILTVVGHPNVRALFEEFDHVQFFAVDFMENTRGLKVVAPVRRIKNNPTPSRCRLNCSLAHAHVAFFLFGHH